MHILLSPVNRYIAHSFEGNTGDYSYPLKGRVSTRFPTKTIAKVIVAVLLGLAVLPITLTVGLVIFCKGKKIQASSTEQLKSIRETIEKAQIDKMASVLDLNLPCFAETIRDYDVNACVKLSEESAVSEADRRAYYEKVFALRDKLANLKGEKDIPIGTAHSLYQEVQELFGQNPQSPLAKTYEGLKKEGRSDPAIQFLRYLAFKYRMAEGKEALCTHAKTLEKKTTDQTPTEYTTGKTAAFSREMISREGVFNRNSKPSKATWAPWHYKEFVQSCTSQMNPTAYDSHSSNPTFVVGKGTYRNKSGQEIHYCLPAGPTPVNDAAYREGFLQVGRELRFNNMDSKKGNEEYFIQNIDQAMNGTVSEHVVHGFDAKYKTPFLKQALESSADPKAFIEKYQKFLLHKNSRKLDRGNSGNGIYIPEKLLSDDQIKLACTKTRELLIDDAFNQAYSQANTKEKQEMLRGVGVAIDTLMSVGITVNFLESISSNLPPDSDDDLKQVVISIACKQCYDRGPVYLALFMLYMRSLENEGLLTQEEHQTMSALFERANIGEDRTALKHRFVIYSQIANQLSNKMDKLAKCTKEYKEACWEKNSAVYQEVPSPPPSPASSTDTSSSDRSF